MIAVNLRDVIAIMNSVAKHQTNRVFYDDPTVLGAQVHPLTCGNDSRHRELHAFYEEENQTVVLLCPDCTYRQVWHDFNSGKEPRFLGRMPGG